MSNLWDIYITFFKMGAVTFGGGYAMLPILQREAVQNKHWIDNETVMDYYAISQGLPGIIAVNVSTFIGNKVRGVKGAIAAAAGVVSPCIIVITIIAAFLSNFQENIYVRHALNGISICVSALIVDAVFKLWEKGIVDKVTLIICLVVFLSTMFFKLSPILYVIVAAALGILVKGRRAQ